MCLNGRWAGTGLSDVLVWAVERTEIVKHVNTLIAELQWTNLHSFVNRQPRLSICHQWTPKLRCVKLAHIFQAGDAKTHQSWKIVLELSTDNLQSPRTPETISGVL